MKNQLIRSSIKSASTMAIGACALATCATAATTVPVPNGSFETPNVTGIAPYFAEHTASGTPIIGTWVRYGGFAAVVEGGRYGVSPIGLDGTQFGDQTASGGSGVFQDIAPYDGSGSAAQYWQADTIYSFTVGVFTRSDNAVAAAENARGYNWNKDQGNGFHDSKNCLEESHENALTATKPGPDGLLGGWSAQRRRRNRTSTPKAADIREEASGTGVKLSLTLS